MIKRDLYNIRVKDDYKDNPSNRLLESRLPWLTAINLRYNLEKESRERGNMYRRYRLEKA